MRFPHHQDRSSYSIVLDSHHKLKGNFHNVQSRWCPANEGEGCPQIPCRRNPLRWPQPWLPDRMVHLPKESSWHVHHKHEKDLGETSVGSVSLVPLKAQLVSVSPSPGILASQPCWTSLPPLEQLLLLAALLPETSLTSSRQPSGSQDFWWFLIPGLTTSLPEASCVNPLTIVLCNTDSPLCCVDITFLCTNKGAHSVGLM